MIVVVVVVDITLRKYSGGDGFVLSVVVVIVKVCKGVENLPFYTDFPPETSVKGQERNREKDKSVGLAKAHGHIQAR